MKSLLIAAAALAIAAPTVAATNAVTSFSGGTRFDFFASNETVGWVFDTSAQINVTALAWNASIAGNSSRSVGIWNTAGALLASVIVPAGAPNDGIWRFAAITPLTLTAGNRYFIGGQDTDADSDSYVTSVSNLVLAPQLTFIGSAVSPAGSGFAFPSSINNTTTGGRFGPSFQFNAAVPEPASWALMIVGFGLVGVSMRRRKSAVAA